MLVRLSSTTAVPIYAQIVEQLSAQIATGRLSQGDRLPSVRELARALPVNQNTVLKAYELLERDGLIERRQGDGTFVAANGSPLRKAERRRRVGRILAQAVTLAAHLEIPPEELHRLLDEQLDAVRKEGVGPEPGT